MTHIWDSASARNAFWARRSGHFQPVGWPLLVTMARRQRNCAARSPRGWTQTSTQLPRRTFHIVCLLLSALNASRTCAKFSKLAPTSAQYFDSIFTDHADQAGLFQTLNLSYSSLSSTVAPQARICIENPSDKSACARASSALLTHYRRQSSNWRIVSHMYSAMRSAKVADFAVDNITTKFGGASTPRTVEFGERGINWTHNPFWESDRDAEWAWGLHRQPFWMSLAYAYSKTHDEKYFSAWEAQFRGWLSQCPRDPYYNYDWGITWVPTKTGRKKQLGRAKTWPNLVHPHLSWAWRRVDAGRRALQIAEQLQHFLKSPQFSPQLLVLVLRSVHEHGEFLAGNPHHDFTRDNHGLFEAEGSAAIGILFPEFVAATSWRHRSFDVLKREMKSQIREDGMQIENTVAYHGASIRILTDTPILAEKNGFSGFPTWYWWRVRKMLTAMSVLTFPSGQSVQFGDQGTRMNAASVVHRLSQIVAEKTDGSPLDLEAHVNGKPGGVRLPYSGFYSMRGRGEGQNGTMLVLRCGPSYNAHTHKDAGTFELASHGQILLSDAGCFTYNGIKDVIPTDERRQYYQGTAAHQTLTLDSRDAHIPSLQDGPFRHLKGYDDCGLLLWNSSERQIVLAVESRHTYRDPDLSHRRMVVYFVEEDAFVFIDEAIGPATGLVEVHFHLDAAVASLDPVQLSAHTLAESGPNVLVKGIGSDGLNVSLRESTRSPEMGKEIQRKTVTYARVKTSATTVRFITIVAPYISAESPRLEASVAEPPGSTNLTVRLTHQLQGTENEEHVVRLAHVVFNAEKLEMAPPSREFVTRTEALYNPYYNNFRLSDHHKQALHSQLPIRHCTSECKPRISISGYEHHILDIRKSLVYVSAKSYLYCGIPKCGVSRWRRLSRRVSGVADWANQKAHNTKENGLEYVSRLYHQDSRMAAESVLNDPDLHSFVIVRSPYARLLSSWLDKRNFPSFHLPQSFDEFVKWVVSRTDDQLNEHFLPMTAFCGMTEGVKFDAVYKLEEMDNWGPKLVMKLNLTDAVSNGWSGGTFFRNSNFSHNHFSDLRLKEFYTDKLMSLIAERYWQDFEILGYDPRVLI